MPVVSAAKRCERALTDTASPVIKYYAHCGCAALIIATIPACTAAGRRSHVRTTVARSSGNCDTPRTHFSCTKVFCRCAKVAYWCPEEEGECSLGVGFCATCVAVMSRWCACGNMPKGGFEPSRTQRGCSHLEIEFIGVLQPAYQLQIVTHDLPTQTRRASSAMASSAHGCHAAWTIARIPTFTAAGRCAHASTTRAKSSGRTCTLRAHSPCNNVLSACMVYVDWGEASVGASPPQCVDVEGMCTSCV